VSVDDGQSRAVGVIVVNTSSFPNLPLSHNLRPLCPILHAEAVRTEEDGEG
jgi:hypothetical protein